MKNIVFTLSIFLSFSLLGQDTINNIKHNIKSIESSITDSVTFSIEELYGVVTDGGGSVKTYLSGKDIVKVKQQVSVSYGRLTTVLVLSEGLPIYIMDREENFDRNETESSWKYDNLNTVYQVELFITDYLNEDYKWIENGERKLSEDGETVDAYFQIVNKVKEKL